MHFRTQFVAAIAMMSLVLGSVPTASVRALSIEPLVEPRDLIRGESFSAVYYYGEDGFRYVFPNEKTYSTWYRDFDDVETISDAELAMIQLGGNVTYNPGSKMVKINSDPKTYYVSFNGTLRWVASEEVAEAMYGSSWNTKIDDIPDGFFTNYTIGEPIESLDDMDEAWCAGDPTELCAIYTISEDKNLSLFESVVIEDMSFGSELTIRAGQTVKWTNKDSVNHTATADDNSWGTGTIKPDGAFVRRFDEPGTYTYFCSYHPEMTGTIVVEEALTM